MKNSNSYEIGVNKLLELRELVRLAGRLYASPIEICTKTKPNRRNVLVKLTSRLKRLNYRMKMDRIINNEKTMNKLVIDVSNKRFESYRATVILRNVMSDSKTPGKARFEMNVGLSSTPNSRDENSEIRSPKTTGDQDQNGCDFQMNKGSGELGASGVSCVGPRPLNEILCELENVRPVESKNMETEAEFTSETSSLLEDIIKLMNNTEASFMCSNWEQPDPDLERSIMEVLDGVVLHTSFELEDHLQGWRLDLFDKIGGQGTLREIWARVKNLKQVVGIKRKLTDSLTSEDTSAEDKDDIDL